MKKKPPNPEAIRLGKNIRLARKAAKLSQSKLAESCGWVNDDGDPAQARISFYEKGEREAGIAEITAIAAATGKPTSFFYNDNFSELSPGPLLTKSVPLISFVKAGELCEAEDPYPIGEAERWVETYIQVKEGMYALRIEGDSMVNPIGSPSFPEGMIIIVDPTTRAENGKFVIARDGDGKATFKKLSIDGDRAYLVPLNPRYNPIPIQHELHICGVVVAAQFDLR